MNLFSGFKKIFLIGVCVVSLFASSAFAVEIIGGVARKTGTTHNSSTGASVNLSNPPLVHSGPKKGTAPIHETPTYVKDALKNAYTAAGSNFENMGIDDDNIYINNSSSGATYVERREDSNGVRTDRVIAISTPAGTFIPLTATTLNSTGATNFFRAADTGSGYTAGTVQRNSQLTNNSDENTALQQDRLKTLQQQRDDIIKQLNNPNLTPEERARLQADLKAKNAEVANQAEVNSGIERTNQENEECSIIPPNITACILEGLAWVSLKIFSLASYVLGLAGNLLDYSIELSVNSAEFLQSLNVVEPMWNFIRDILNMSFIFILLWIAINIVLDRSGLPGKKYTLRTDVRNVVVVAILINFSLFFAQLFVDGSNLVTLEIYQQIKPLQDPSQPDKQIGISDQIMNSVGLQGLVNISDIFGDGARLPDSCSKLSAVSIAVGVFGTIFILILSIAFGLAAILFFIRLPNMIYLFISSPLWIWGHVMKMGFFETLRKKWADNMLHMCVFPIVYMMWMFVGLFTFKQLVGTKSDQGSFLKLLCENTNSTAFQKSLSVALIFCVIIYVMMQAVKYAMSKGAGTGIGSSVAKKVTERADRWQKGVTAGSYAMAKGTAKFAAKPLVFAKDSAVGVVRRGTTALSNKVADYAGNKAANTENQTIKGILTSASDKLRNPKIFGKTHDEAKKEITKKEEERTAKYMKVLKDSGTFKIESKEDYLKKNKNASDADYAAYEKKKVETILNAQLGQELLNTIGEDGIKTHQQAIMDSIYVDEMKNGKATGKKILSNAQLWKKVTAIQTYHSKGKGKATLSLSTAHAKRMGMRGWAAFDPEQSKAKGQAAGYAAEAKAQETEAKQKENKKAKLQEKKEDLKKKEETLKYHPGADDVDDIINDPAFTSDPNEAAKYGSKVLDYKANKKQIDTSLILTADQKQRLAAKNADLLEQFNKVRDRKKKEIADLKETIEKLEEEPDKK